MKIQYLLLTLFLSISYSALSQSKALDAGLTNYLENEGVRGEYDEAYEKMFIILASNFKNTEIMEEDWAALRKDKEENIDDAIFLVVASYKDHLSAEDMAVMEVFYKSDASVQLRTDPTALTKEQKEKLDKFENNEVGQRIAQVSTDISSELNELFEVWKRDLFGAKMTQLVKMGYRNQ